MERTLFSKPITSDQCVKALANLRILKSNGHHVLLKILIEREASFQPSDEWIRAQILSSELNVAAVTRRTIAMLFSSKLFYECSDMTAKRICAIS